MSSLYFHEDGDGVPLVFLHGFCETHEIWNEFVRPLATHFHIFTLDLPGFGKSKILPAPFSIDQVADSVANWLIENKIPKSIVIGHSLGGYVTLALAERHAELLTGFGLFHSTSFADTDEKIENRNRVIEFVRKNGVPSYIDTFIPGLFFDKANKAIKEVHRIAVQTKVATLVGYSQAMRDRPDRSFILGNHKIPKFLIAGTEDTLIPIASSRKMAEIGQNCRFYELKEVAHMGIFEAESECQNLISESVLAFINNK